MRPDNSVPNSVASLTGARPAGAVSPQISLRRSRIGLWVPTLGFPVILVLSAVLVAVAHAPPGLGDFAMLWALLVTVLLTGPAKFKARRHPPQTDQAQRLMTFRTWTGTRTISLNDLASVRRVKWTFWGGYGPSRTVDCLILTDRAGVRLSVPCYQCGETVRYTLQYQHKHGLPPAKVSRFAAIGVRLEPDSRTFRAVRAVIAVAAVAAITAVLFSIVVWVIPALAP